MSAQAEKTVLIIGTFLSHHSGTRSVCEDLTDSLVQHGWQTVTASRSPSSVVRLFDMLWTTWRARRVVQVAQVDVYSGRAFVWAEATCLLLRLLGKPIVLTLHGGNLPQFARRWPRRVRRLLAQGAQVTTPSHYLFDQMRVYCESLRILPNSLPIAKYHYRARERCDPQLIWLRAFHHVYNPSLAIELVARLKEAYPEIKLTMVGPDKGDGALQEAQALCVQLGVEEQVHFVGPVPKQTVPDWLDKGDIFINTTDIDNTPVSVIEALASGLCVVSTNVGGIPYLLRDQENALLVAPQDVDAMHAAVVRLLDAPETARALSQRARAYAVMFDAAQIMVQWDEMLADLIGA